MKYLKILRGILSTIFDSDNDWELAFAAVKQEAEMLSRFVGHVGDSAALLQSALEADLKIERDLEKVYVYAHQIYCIKTQQISRMRLSIHAYKHFGLK